eukprot:1415208-Rhodomonas_salina.1
MMVFDVPMAKSWLLYNTAIAKLSPDCIMSLCKECKYGMLQSELQSLTYTITIVPFIIGSRSLLIEEDWTKHWTSLGLQTNALQTTIIAAMVSNQEALSDILA